MKKSLLIVSSCFALLHGATVLAQQTRSSEFGGSISVTPMYVENATASSDEDEQIDETQISYGARLEGDWEREYAAASLNYNLTETKYLDDSQADDGYWDGESSLLLGNSWTFYELNASHSVRQMLTDPNASPLLQSNNESRNILSVAPLIRSSQRTANTFSLGYTYQAVNFKDSESNDSTREGVNLYYTRHLTPTRDLTVSLGEREIDYDTSDFADYDMRFIALGIDVERRNYYYRLSLGYTKISPFVGDDFSSPTMDFELSWQKAGSRFTLFADRSVSDSSMGNGNRPFFSSEVSFDNSLQDLDQIERTSAGMGWAYDGICLRCNLSTNIGLEKMEYVNQTINDTDQAFADIGFSYQISRPLSAGISLGGTDTRYSNSASTRSDVKIRISRFNLIYRLNRAFNITFLYEYDKRESEGAGNYVVKTTSLALTYDF